MAEARIHIQIEIYVCAHIVCEHLAGIGVDARAYLAHSLLLAVQIPAEIEEDAFTGVDGRLRRIGQQTEHEHRRAQALRRFLSGRHRADALGAHSDARHERRGEDKKIMLVAVSEHGDRRAEHAGENEHERAAERQGAFFHLAHGEVYHDRHHGHAGKIHQPVLRRLGGGAAGGVVEVMKEARIHKPVERADPRKIQSERPDDKRRAAEHEHDVQQQRAEFFLPAEQHRECKQHAADDGGIRRAHHEIHAEADAVDHAVPFRMTVRRSAGLDKPEREPQRQQRKHERPFLGHVPLADRAAVEEQQHKHRKPRRPPSGE